MLTAAPAAEDARLLDFNPSAALLVETRIIQDQHGRAIESTTSAYVADRYALQVRFRIGAPLPR